MNTFDFIVLILAAWRIAHLLVAEQGPWNVFGRMRRRAGIEQVIVQTPQGADIAYSARTQLAEGLLCVWCVSVWTAALWMGLWSIPALQTGVLLVARIFAISAGAIIVQESLERLRNSHL